MASKYQKRHYIDIAKLLNDYVKDDETKVRIDPLIYDFICLFGRDNPNFNRDTFENAVYKGSTVDLSKDVHIGFTNY
tara:strand:+ start:259 stop:489 length:231 start_codon:yes stop_codon:yes gene_type:complete